MTEPWTQAQYETARASGWAPYETEQVWRDVRCAVRRTVEAAPPLPPHVKAELRAILAAPRRWV